MTAKDLEILSTEKDRILAEWWCTLNRWGWPGDLPDPEPRMYIHNGRRSQIMGWIEGKIGHKLCLRAWNKKMDIPDAEFDQWYKELWKGRA